MLGGRCITRARDGAGSRETAARERPWCVVWERMRIATILLALSACGSSASKPDAATGNGPDAATGNGADAARPTADASVSACASGGTALTMLPACTNAATSSIVVPSGCTPTIDGTLHAEEWSDGVCFDAGGDTVVMKHDATQVYLAFSATPSCGCPMNFMFDPDGTGTSGDEFSLNLFDDPFQTDGDRSDWTLSGTTWSSGTAPAGIVTRCPGGQPSPINYEISLPYAALGITAGGTHTFRLAIQHVLAGWPAAVAGGSSQSTDPSMWGTISATTW
jgi:hypothetical protein